MRSSLPLSGSVHTVVNLQANKAPLPVGSITSPRLAPHRAIQAEAAHQCFKTAHGHGPDRAPMMG